MPIFRVHKNKGFTIVSNNTFGKNSPLSAKAKGLLVTILTLPDDWEFSMSGLVDIMQEGESAIKTAMDELKKHGYLTVEKHAPTKANGGRFEYVYNIHEEPGADNSSTIESDVRAHSNDEDSRARNSEPRNDAPILNTNIPSTNTKDSYSPLKEYSYNNLPIVPPAGGRERKNEKPKAEGFEEFYAAYPRHEGRKPAEKAWNKLNPDEKLRGIINAAVKFRREHGDWYGKEKRFIPLPATFLNDKRWTDEVEPTPSQPATTALGENVTGPDVAAAKEELFAKLDAQLERMRREDDEKRGIGG